MSDHSSIQADVWEACKSGDREAFGTIYRFYYPKLYNYGYKFIRDIGLIEDSIQEVFTAFWCRRERFSEIRELKSYLFVSFRHELLKEIENKKNHKLLSLYTSHFPLELAVDEFFIDSELQLEQQQYLKKALTSLTSRQREAIFLKFFENMTYQEIAEVLNISVKAAYKLVGRAIKELRKFSHHHPILALFILLAETGLYLGAVLAN